MPWPARDSSPCRTGSRVTPRHAEQPRGERSTPVRSYPPRSRPPPTPRRAATPDRAGACRRSARSSAAGPARAVLPPCPRRSGAATFATSNNRRHSRQPLPHAGHWPAGRSAGFHEALRQHVLHEATQELLRRQRQRLLTGDRPRSPCSGTSPGRPRSSTSRWLLMATRCVYRARYFSTCSGPPNGGLAYTTQSLAYSGANQREGRRVRQRRQHGRARPACPASSAARKPARNLPRKTRLSTRTGRKKPGRHDTQRGDASTTPCGIARQAAAGHHAMHVRMMVQVLAPGVQHHQHADLAPSRFGLAATSRSVAAAAWNSRSYSDARVGQGQLGKLGRQREDHVVVFDRQQVLGLALQPAGAGQGLALGTVAVAARVVGDAVVAAVQATLDVAAQRRRAAAARSRSALLCVAGQALP